MFLLATINLHAQNKVYIGVYIKNLSVNDRDESYIADIYWWIKFKIPSDTGLIKEMSKLEFTNSQEIQSVISEQKTIGNIRYVTGQYKGLFKYKANYRDYPVDRQELPIIIESLNLSSDQLILIPDSTAYAQTLDKKSRKASLDPDIEIPQYSIESAKFSRTSKLYNTNFGDPTMDVHLSYSRITYKIIIQRKSMSFILKILIPNIFLLVIAYLVFFIPAIQLDVAVGCTVTSLLASIALQLAISNGLPEVGYLTNADKLFYSFYFLITAALVQTVISFGLEKRGKTKIAKLSDLIGRIVYPVIAIACIIIHLFIL